jgi:flavin reductase (DIM6/NTAB) family NADH-FMN oxidoreductase RutF
MPVPPVELFRRLTNGVYVVTASHRGRHGGFTAAWVTQVSFDPLLVAVSINPGNATWPLIEESRRLVINVLASGQLDVARRFGLQSGRDVDKFSGIGTRAAPDGPPVLAESASWLGCRVEQQMPAGDHIVVVARVVAGGVLDPDAAPLVYADTGNMDGSAALYPDEIGD